MAKFLDQTGLTYFWGKIKTLLDSKASSDHTHGAASATESGFMTHSMFTKLDGIEAGATKVIVDASLSETSTNAVQNKAVYAHVANFNKFMIDTVPSTYSPKTHDHNSQYAPLDGYETLSNEVGRITDVVIPGLAPSQHEHSVATETLAGFMSKDMVNKLNGIEAGANNTVVDTALSLDSTNPVANNVVSSAISARAAKVHNHDNASLTDSGFMPKEMYQKLNGIAEGATKVIVDSSLSSTSTNAIENKAVYAALSGMEIAIQTKLSSVYFPAGSNATVPDIADVTTGAVYNITAEFTTTAAFVEGAGVKYPAGTNIVKTSDGKWDVLAGFIDLSPFAKTTDIDDLQDQIDDIESAITTITNAEIDTMMSA
jgi:hypothetical protein